MSPKIPARLLPTSLLSTAAPKTVVKRIPRSRHRSSTHNGMVLFIQSVPFG
jgi:hypothetical protein